jgi:signal transduction histidine kinase
MSHMPIDKPESHRLNNLDAFNSITEKIAEHEEDLEELLRSILGLTASMFHISYAAILLLDERQNQFDTVVTYGDFPIALDPKSLVDVSRLLACPPANGKKLVFNRLVTDSKWHALKTKEQRYLGEVICSPLVIHQKTIGVACVYSEDSDPAELESHAFRLWANLASLAIEKSRLYHQIRTRLEITHKELKRAESQLIRSEKLSSLGEIAMSVAHAIRNPVMVIGGFSRRLHHRLPQDDPKRAWSEIILSEASRLEGIVEEFKGFYSINQISFQTEDVNRLVQEAEEDFLSECKPRPGFTLERILCNEPLMCSVDPDLLGRCVIHLLTNARESSRNGVHITLGTSREGKDAIIDVIDSGKGMSTKEMNHVFDPFYTTKGDGAGMGLTFVHFVISEHSGQIDLRSMEGVGTRFRIRLPLIEEGSY